MHKTLSRTLVLLMAASILIAGCNRQSEQSADNTINFSALPAPTWTPRPLHSWEIIEDAIVRRSEINIIDCDMVEASGPKREAADACAVAAFQQRKPFRMRYTIYDKNGTINKALVGTSKGLVYFLTNQEKCCEDALAWSSEHECKHPVIVSDKGKKRLICGDKNGKTNTVKPAAIPSRP